MTYFSTSIGHILAELERIDLLIHVHVHKIRKIQTTDSAFRGLYLSEEQIDNLLANPIGQPHWSVAPNSQEFTDVKETQGELREAINRRKINSCDRGVELRFHSLIQKFKLSILEADIILITLAIEIDLRYEKLYAYLQDDITKKQPSVDLALNLLTSSLDEKLILRQCFMPNSALIKYHLLHLLDDPSQPHTPLLGKFLKLDGQVVNYLLNQDEIDICLQPYLRRISPQKNWDDIIFSEDFKRQLSQLSSSSTFKVLHFIGARGTGKQATAEVMCQQMGIQLLIVNANNLLDLDDSSIEVKLRFICREAILQNAALYWREDNLGSSGKIQRWRAFLLQLLNEYQVFAFLASEAKWETGVISCSPILVEFAYPTVAERMQLWQKFLPNVWQSEAELIEISSKFRFCGGDIKRAITTAENLARWRSSTTPDITMGDCYEACRQQSSQRLGLLANKVKPHYRWQDIILPEEQLQQLQEICGHVKYRSLVYDEWGFDRKLALGKGLTVLFSGSSGTGKTMAADIIAGELGLNLYKIDLSIVVSKYIGETEKNLSLVFQEAESSHSILFFDEADALFGKRSDVKDAHDRYANIETGYLLQRMEEYEGVVILATNLHKNMDDAFTRRLQFSIHFPFPNERDRLRIWEKVFPDALPLSPKLNLEFIAKHFELSGGSIRNVALATAFLAAEDGRVVQKKHLVHAIKREYQKVGRMIAPHEFEGYLNPKSK